MRFAIVSLLHASALIGCLLPVSGRCATHGRGLVEDPPSTYRSFPSIPRYRAFLPSEADISADFPRPGNQGMQSSCTAWSVAYAMRSYYGRAQYGWSLDDKSHLFSPAYLYNQLRSNSPGPGCDTGTSIAQALTLVKRGGLSTLADFPYSAASCSQLPDSAQAQAAQSFRIDGWRTINTSAGDFLDDVKGQIEQGNPVIFGMEIEDSLDNLKAGQIYDNMDPADRSGHAMVVVGYSEHRQAFKIMNSWGTGWGDGGFGWISYRAFRQFVNQAYVATLYGLPAPIHIAQPQPTPVVTPPAPPVIAIVTPTPTPTPEPAPKPVPPPQPVPAPPPAPVVIAIVPPAPAPLPQPPAPPSPPPPMVITPAELHRVATQLDDQLRSFECARLSTDFVAPMKIGIHGYIGSDSDLQKLKEQAESAAGAEHLQIDVDVTPWPLCEVQQTLETPLAQPQGMSLKVIGGAGVPTQLHDRESFGFVLDAPDFGSYLYLVYVDVEGTATVLLQPQGLVPNSTLAHSTITIGQDAGGPRFQVGTPFGREMVVAIASASPLFDQALPLQQTERQFLTLFRAAYIAASASGKTHRRVAAAVAPLLTGP